MNKPAAEESQKGFERMMTPFYIGVFATMWFVSGGLAITGFVLGINTQVLKTAKPDPNLVMVLVGIGGLVLPFPLWYVLGFQG
jgi:hypothetical protein